MASLYLILTSLIFPVLAISWLCCIACCIYRGLLRNLNKPGRTTKVQVSSDLHLVYCFHLNNILLHIKRYIYSSLHFLHFNRSLLPTGGTRIAVQKVFIEQEATKEVLPYYLQLDYRIIKHHHLGMG